MTSIDDQYEVTGTLGEGPYATVYGAIDVEGEEVAVKVFEPRIRRDPAFTAYFRRDAKAMQAVRHDHLLPIHAYGVDRDSYYVVTPVVWSHDLKGGARTLVPASVARTGADVALVLDLLHRHGQVHGAIKPTNLALTEDDDVIVMPAGGRHSVLSTMLPEAELRVLSYATPEQIAGRPITAATDIYSLGVVLYEACTGTLPFPGKNAAEVAARHVDGALESPRTRRATVPQDLDRIILRCLELDPADRYDSAAELADDLVAHSTVSLPLIEEHDRAEGRARR